MKKLVLIFLTFIFSTSLCFADSDSSAASAADLPQSALLSTVTDVNEIALDNTLREAAVKLAATSSTYTADDIYNLLVSIRTVYGGSSYFRVIDPQVTSSLTDIYTRMALYQSSMDNLISSNNSIDSTLTNIYDSIGAGTAGYNVLTLLDSLLHEANSINDNLEYNDGTTVQGLGLMVQFIQRFTNSMNNTLSICEDHLQSFVYDFATIHTSMGLLQSALDSIHNDTSDILSVFSSLDKLSWLDTVNIPVLGYSYTVEDALAGTYFTPSGYPASYNDFYIVIDSTSLYNKALKFNIPFYSINIRDFNIDFMEVVGNTVVKSPFDDILFFNNNSLSSTIIVYGLDYAYSSPNKILMHISRSLPSQNIYYYNGSASVSYLNFDSMDYQFLSMALSLRLLTSVYASDDLIAAKEAQQSTESQVLSDFTGSGSAAVSTNDIGLAKDTSTALSNGLNTGVSSSEAFKVFNPQNSLFSWFTDTTRVNLSTDYEWSLILPNRRLKTTNNDNGTLFYDDNISAYERGVLE